MTDAAMVGFGDRQIIFRQGQMDTNLYKIISGKVGLYIDYGTSKENFVGMATAPGYLGSRSALASYPSSYTAVALSNVMLLRLPDTQLITLAKNDPGASIHLMKKMAKYITEKDEELYLLLSELKELVSVYKPDRRALRNLVTRYEEIIADDGILDEFEPYIPMPPPPPTTPSVTFDNIYDFADFYLPGHRSYPGITHPEYKKYLISVEYTCPHCQSKFRGNKILMSQLIPERSNAEELRYDLRVSYRGFETEWYEILTCPRCWFSSFESYFREEKTLFKSRYEEKLAQFYSEATMDFERERDLDFVFAQHYLALLCAPGFTDMRQIVARVWMNLVRLYQDAGEEELALFAEKKAVDSYQTVYMECDLTPGQEQRLCLTVAGMLYARGEKKEARVWASRVRTATGERSAYWHLAEQLMQDIRAELIEENEA